jgi:hypothetical protein
MTPRFHLGDHGDRSILGRTTEIKITMFKDTDGTVCGGFELSGHLGSDEEEVFGGAATADDLTFLRQLLDSFERKVRD